MNSQIIMLHNPFCPDRSREIFAVDSPLSIRDWLDSKGIEEFEQPTICIFNGEPLLRGRWADTVITNNDTAVFVTLPQGGGGGSGSGDKVLRSVLTIAVMVAAPYIGGSMATAMGITGKLGTALLTAGVAMAGSALVNVVVPPPMPSTGFNGSFGNTPAASPTYSLQVQGNQARLSQPIPVIYGRHIIYPDLAASPYSVYVNNDQYLHQLHCIGQGEYELEQIRIEDTPISSFAEITYEVVAPNSPVTLFDPDVVTAPEVAGQELLSVNDGGGWCGGFIANPAETVTTSIGIDIFMPRGLYYAHDSGGLDSISLDWQVQARLIDDSGNALGSWFTLGTVNYTAATKYPAKGYL